MNRKPLLEKLAAYQPFEDSDKGARQRLTDFVNEHSDCFERSLKVGHVTGSVWLVDDTGQNVLLTHHRKLNIWIQLGGHCDGESDTVAVALREAQEESGIMALKVLSEDIFDLDIHPIPARGDEPEHFHYDVRYVIQTQGNTNFVVSEESHDLAWIPIEKLSDYSQETSMLRMGRKWQTQLQSLNI